MRDRTADLLRARQALSQLSYGPLFNASPPYRSKVVGLGGLEPPTSPLSGHVCSPGRKGHDDLTSSPPSSGLSPAVSPECPPEVLVTEDKGCARYGT
ncbi:hypothetical protein ElyMa_003838100 [Elysia marginata]|uniref:Uncharacterized protein n=1 Tax=Elysia marginata TaxID=1093978 RepID=A0AAV4FGD3_9GAST|nr:hypothetical protein ElyMa_003838100 [Elysia marginata]